MRRVKMSIPFVQIYKTFEKSLGKEQAEEIVEELYKLIEEIKEEKATKEGMNNFRIEMSQNFDNIKREQEILKLSLEAKIEENRKEIELIKKETEGIKRETESIKKGMEEIKKEIEEIKKEIKELEIRIYDKISETKNSLILWMLGVWLFGIILLFVGKIFKIY
ncbi:MAG: hypothetical protein ACP5Q5_08075 [Brevinematia bacterium]